MKKNKSTSMLRVYSALTLLTLLISAGLANEAFGQAAVPHPPATGGPVDALQAWPESDTVRELLRSDAAAALAAQRYQKAADWIQTTRPPSDPATTHNGGEKTDVLGVRAIYGVGKTLQAELAINGQLVRSRPGQRVHAAYGETAAYVVLAIEGSCVRLRKDNETRTTCLNRVEQP